MEDTYKGVFTSSDEDEHDKLLNKDPANDIIFINSPSQSSLSLDSITGSIQEGEFGF